METISPYQFNMPLVGSFPNSGSFWTDNVQIHTTDSTVSIPDTVQITQPGPFKLAGAAIKFDQGKLPLHLLSTEAMNQTAAVLQFGAQKYAEHNWRKGFTWSRPLAAAMRHITAFNNGEDKDPESGFSHLAHAACCIMFLLEFEKTHKHLDDRYKASTNV